MKILFWLSIGMDRRTPSEHLLTDMVESLYQGGHTVHVLQKNTHGTLDALPKKMVELGVETTRIECPAPLKMNLAGRFAADVVYVMRCMKWLKKHKEFDRFFMQSSNVAGIQTRVLHHVQKHTPVVFNVQDIFPENAVYIGKMKKNGLLYKCFSFMQRHAYRYATKIITISEDMKEQLIQLGTPKDKIEVVYNWSYRDTMYDPKEIDYSCLGDRIDRSKFNVVYAGNIGLMQNVEVVIRSAAQMKAQEDICFHVIGDGVHRRKLEQLASELQTDHVTFHDMMGADCAPAIYSAADVNIIPLAENIYRTALPSKTATCLACGKPIVFAIGTESKFGKTVCEQADARVVGSNDVEGLCKAIQEIKQSGNGRDNRVFFLGNFRRSENSRKYAEMITQ